MARIERNNFIKNSFIILKKVSKEIANGNLTTDWDVIQNILLSAVGIEKLLKGILHSVNPLYVLKSPDFKNSALITYSAIVEDKSECVKNPDEDVIAYQSSVLRATVFSKAALSHKNTLMKLKNARDIIVHNDFNKLEISELRILLNRDFYPLLSDFSDEHELGGKLNFFNNHNSKLAKISSTLQEDVAKQIKLKIESSESYWNTLKGTSTFNRNKCEFNTVEFLRKKFTYPTECPSCKNQSVVFTTPIMEYDSYKNEVLQTGLETKGLKCEFCKLQVSDYKELDYLEIKPDVEKKDEIIREYSDEIEENEE